LSAARLPVAIIAFCGVFRLNTFWSHELTACLLASNKKRGAMLLVVFPLLLIHALSPQ